MRLTRSSLRISRGNAVLAASGLLTIGLGLACGGGGAAAPTPTVVPSAAVSPVVAASPQRPALASPAPSPSAVVAAATPTATAEVASGETYEVGQGDTLAVIADKQYGDGTQWRRIYDANRDLIGADPDKLQIGMKLKIPPKQS